MSSLDDFLKEQEDIEKDAPEATEQTQETEVETKEEEAPAAQEETEETKTEETKEEEAPAIAPESSEVEELRQFIREQRREIAAMKAKLSRLGQEQKVDDDGNPIVELTGLEQAQAELHNIAVTRAPYLQEMVEVMANNPKFADIYEVCTKSNFDDMFERAASHISRSEGKDFNEVLVQLELEVWKKPNPYRYMYGLIKEHHPKYVKLANDAKEKEKSKKEESNAAASAKRVLEAKAAPGSVAAAVGSDKGSGAWTAERIDEMDELELGKVPEEIYTKYLAGQLK